MAIKLLLTSLIAVYAIIATIFIYVKYREKNIINIKGVVSTIIASILLWLRQEKFAILGLRAMN